MNLAEILAQSSLQYGAKPAIVFSGNTFSFQDIHTQIARHAAYLQALGVTKGDRIALQLPKGMEFIFLHLAVLAVGAVSLPLNIGYTPDEIAYFLTNSGSSLYITSSQKFKAVQRVLKGISGLRSVLIDAESPDRLGPLSDELKKIGKVPAPEYPTQANDVAMICYTSGTTGKPKGAMITHLNLISNMKALKEVWRWTDRDVLLHVLPLFHVHGLVVALHGGLNAGSTIILHEKFDPEQSLAAIAREKCTMFMAVPTIYYRLISAIEAMRPDLSSMRVFISGSAPLLENLFQQFETVTGFRILERYGMTETQMIASNPYDPKRRIPQSVGYPLPGIRIRVVSRTAVDVAPGQVGEVWIKGDNVFKGYWQMPDKNRDAFAQGWFKSGDLGYQAPADDMRLYLVGRAKELIISGGYNVYPKEVENVLETHEAIQEAAVIGVADADFGERVTAVVSFKPDLAQVPSGKELIAYCKTRLAGYKCPKQVFRVEGLPRNAMGKIQKHMLPQMISADVQA